MNTDKKMSVIFDAILLAEKVGNFHLEVDVNNDVILIAETWSASLADIVISMEDPEYPFIIVEK